MNTQQTKKTVFSAFFVALALLLPFLTGQIQQIGNMLSPMHIPVLLCGFICGWPWGLLVGVISPILRSFIFGMPPLMPVAVAMAFELATYGAVAGILYTFLAKKRINTYISLLLAMLSIRIVWGQLLGGVSPLLRSVMFGMPSLIPVAIAVAIKLIAYGVLSGILYYYLPKKLLNSYIGLILAMLAGRIVWGFAMYFLLMSSGGSFSVQAFMAGAFIKAWPGIILHIAIIPPIILALEKAKLIPLN